MRKNKTLSILLSAVMAVSNVAPIYADVVGTNTGGDSVTASVLRDGRAVNAAIKRLAGNAVSGTEDTVVVADQYVRRIAFSRGVPDDAQAELISSVGTPVYAYFQPDYAEDITAQVDAANAMIEADSFAEPVEGITGSDDVTGGIVGSGTLSVGTIVIATDADSVSYGSDASYMFSGLTALTDINGLQDIKFTDVEDASCMFYADASLTDASAAYDYVSEKTLVAENVFLGTGVSESVKDSWFTEKEESPVPEELTVADEEEQDTISVVEEADDVTIEEAEGVVSGDHTDDNLLIEDSASVVEMMEEENTWREKMRLADFYIGGQSIEEDLSSMRLILATEDADIVIDQEHVISSMDGLYLLQYESVEDAIIA
ncbi:MAG: hypothetical protein Q4B26_19285, partial [Eubacteriales bacterium]|nr:hypothetical protein [Eubacteriales bacterium]